MGSEMCIRDRRYEQGLSARLIAQLVPIPGLRLYGIRDIARLGERCLLYTSDAADERSSVDLGGRRIIKKKNDSERDGVVVDTDTRANAWYIM